MDGIVFYTDGSARPNPGFKGWGVHGYVYTLDTKNKGSGCPNYVTTSSGYIPKSEKTIPDGFNKVLPTQYIDVYSSSTEIGSNNLAEVQAAKYAFDKALEYDIKRVCLITDSKYVIQGITDWSSTWVANNWIRKDGTEVPNKDTWKSLLKSYNTLIAKDTNVDLQWVKGHSDKIENIDTVIGNIKADKLAVLGTLYSTNNKEHTSCTTVQASEYWKNTVQVHPFISNKRMYFNTQAATNVAGEYYLGDHGKDDDLLGKKQVDGTYSVLLLKEPDIMLELIRTKQSSLTNHVPSIVMARLDAIYKEDIYNDILNHHEVLLKSINPRFLDLTYINGVDPAVPITKELRPPLLAHRAVEELSYLKSILDLFISKDKSIRYLDITDRFFNKEVNKKKETILKLKPEIVVGMTTFILNESLVLDKGCKDIKITLTLGVDTPPRNNIKRLEGLNPNIFLVYWQEAPDVLRHATIIESNGSYGIWAGVYSNLVYIDYSI